MGDNMECFTIYANDLKGSLSPLFFISQPKNTKGFIELNKVAVINPSRKVENLNLTDLVPYIGLPETDDLEIKKILRRPYKEVKGRNIIKEGDILFARIEPSIFNKKYIFVGDLQGNKYAFTSTEFYIVKAKENINPKFLFYMFFTKDVFAQVLGRTTGSTGRRRLDKGVFENLLIPYPDERTQNHIVQIMDNAYNLKKSKETEAQKLLDSINDYVLSELGIELPELKDKMTFAVYATDVKGKRVDAYYYQPKFEEVEKAIENGKFEVRKLKDSFEDGLVKGTLPKENEKNGEVKVLQIKNILKNGLINISEYLTAKNIFKSNQKINSGELIIVITGATIGKVGLWCSDEEFYLGGDMVKFKANKNFDPYYIQAFLISQLGQYQILREITGATNKHLAPSDVENLKVPFPPLEIQNKIAEEVKQRMKKAEQLQKEAKETLEKAKQEVEDIILNGVENEKSQ